MKHSRKWKSWNGRKMFSPILITCLVMMALLFLSTVALSIGLWYAAGFAYDVSIKTINDRLREAVVDRIHDYFFEYLKHTRSITSNFASVLENVSEYNKVSSFTASLVSTLLAPLIWSFFKEMPYEVSHLGYVGLDNRAYLYQYMPSANTFTFVFKNESSKDLWYEQSINQTTGTVVSDPVSIPPLTLATSAEFMNQVLGDGATIGWTLFPSSEGPLFICARPLHGTEGNNSALSGLTVAASSTQTLNAYLRAVDFNGATIFVQTKAGLLVASSTSASTFDNSSGQVELINATSAGNLTISDAAQYLKGSYSVDMLFSQPLNLSDITVAGRRSFINTSPIMIDEEEMLVVIVITRDSILGGIDAERADVLLIVCFASIGVLVVGWAVIIFVTMYVSKRMRPKEELLWQQEETQRAQAASEVKSQFLANISHDLRTPMAAILGLLDIILCDRLTAEQEANLRQMKTCAVSLLELLNNLLDLSKVEAGKMQLEVLEFDLVGELESLVDMFSVQGLSNRTEIALDLSDDMERIVKGDPSRVRQVFANLLSNACKFTREGHILLRGWMLPSDSRGISGQLHRDQSPRPDDGKRMITFMFEVDDTGPGIPKEKRELIFEKFQQADLSTTRTHGGTGLGLGIVRSLVKLMGGSIAIIDKEGPGACFRFDLTFECLDQTSNWRNSIVQPEFLLPKLSTMDGGQVLLAMQGRSSGAGIAARWMERRGLHVWHVTEWEDIDPTVSNMVQNVYLGGTSFLPVAALSAPLDHRPRVKSQVLYSGLSLNFSTGTSFDKENNYESSSLILAIIDVSLIPNPFQFLAEELYMFRARLQSQGVVIAWLVEHNTSSETRRALRRSGCAVASKPLYASRLAPLLALATARKGMTQTSSVGSQQFRSAGGSGKTDMSGSGGMRREGSSHLIGSFGQAHSEPGGRHSLSLQDSSEISLMNPPSQSPMQPQSVSSSQQGRPTAGQDQGQVDEKSASCTVDIDTNTEASSSREGSNAILLPENSQSQVISVHQTKAPVFNHTRSAPQRAQANRSMSEIQASPGSALRASGRTRSLVIPKAMDSITSLDGALKGIHVLIVEDTPLLQKVAVIRMQKLGCSVVAVNNGQEAVDAVQASYNIAAAGPPVKPFEVILMDCQMPVLDGYGATAAIREAEKGTNRHIPIIAVTAHAMTSDERKCLDAGMDAYLTKPIDPTLMADIVKRLVKKGDGSGQEGQQRLNEGPLSSLTPLNETFAPVLAKGNSSEEGSSTISLQQQ